MQAYNQEQRPSKLAREELMAKTGLDMKVRKGALLESILFENRNKSQEYIVRSSLSFFQFPIPQYIGTHSICIIILSAGDSGVVSEQALQGEKGCQLP